MTRNFRHRLTHLFGCFPADKNDQDHYFLSKGNSPKIFSLKKIYFLFPLVLIALVINSCNDSFEPFQDNDRYNFSIYGFLDAAVDTQWIRVTPVRKELNFDGQIPDMTLLLKNMKTNEVDTLTSKIIDFRQGFNTINAWSVMPIEPGGIYNVRAESPDGSYSQVTLSIPMEFPTPRFYVETVPGVDPKYFVWIEGLETLADVQSRWYIRLKTDYWEIDRYKTFSHRNRANQVSSDSYSVQIFPDDEIEEIIREFIILSDPDAELEIIHHQIYVAAGGDEWDDNVSLIDDLVYVLPDGFSNIENGLGYMTGIYSKIIPFKSCFDQNRQLVACPVEAPFW